MNKKVRWQQRFQNFEKSFLLLERTIAIKDPSEAEMGGLIQFFEVSFELAWKTLKDYLEDLGFDVKSPKATLQQAFQSEIIKDGHLWVKALEDRNLTAHIYDEAHIEQMHTVIRSQYFDLLKSLYHFLKSELDS